MLWAWLSRSWCDWRSAIHIVKPETVIAWHRRGFRLCWTWTSRHRIGRKAVPHDVRAVICEISTANQLWGAPRIHGALQTLGISVSQSTVAKYMRRHPPPPSQTWRTFLTNHASQIMAADLFVVPTITFRLRFVLVILGHDRRRIVHVAITEHPTAAWTAQQLSERIPREQGTAVSPSRSRCGLGRGRDHHRLDEHPGGSYRPTIAVAECVRGTRHRLDPTGVPRSHQCRQRGGAAPSAHGVRCILHAGPNTSRARQGCAAHAFRHAAVGRAYRRDAASRRASPPRRSRGLAVGRVSRPPLPCRHCLVRRSANALSYSDLP
jgi:hypothetical protein